MDLQQKTRRFGTWVIVCSILLRLFAFASGDYAAVFLSQPNIARILIYLETGRNVRFSFPFGALSLGESPAPWEAPEALPEFLPEQAQSVPVYNSCGLIPDLPRLMAAPLNWYLPLPEPTVLILHAHGTESYTKEGEDYPESSPYRTLEEAHNMLSIGDRVVEILAQHGISALHDRTLHDYPDYNTAYDSARKSAQKYLAAYPSIQLILDLHRDALEDQGTQLSTSATVGEKPSAQLMLVVGTNAGGLSHENWEENVSLGLKLHAQLEQSAPGIMRPMSLRSQRFNQDLLPGALLVEVGAAGNTRAEALIAAEQLAHAIAALSRGTQ